VEFERGGRGGGPASFDLRLQVISADGSTVLQSECMTIIGK
jgi:hypothetical protein